MKDLKEYRCPAAGITGECSGFQRCCLFLRSAITGNTDVPVGIIHSSWGASIVQAWTSAEVLGKYQDFDIENADMTKSTNLIPTALFNSMIYPLIPFTIRGVLWYQGESNRSEPGKYSTLFPAMVRDWRERWGLGDFPFFYVQIAPYSYSNKEAFNSVENTAFLREAQIDCLDPDSTLQWWCYW
ncbi:MAG: sialate O-acetylesterase [Bacteroidales bacterium]